MALNAQTDPEAGAALLERIVRTFTKHHEDLRIEIKEHIGGTLFDMQCHGAEGPRICGKKGRNIRSIQTIFSEIGRHNRTVYAVRLQDPQFGDWEQRLPDPPRTYNHAKALHLLEQVFMAMLGPTGWSLAAVTGPSATAFMITSLSQPNHQVLTTVQIFTNLSVLESLQTIWKAYGREEGWHFTVEMK